MHTASFWNITIQWTSHDDLTEKICVCLFWEAVEKFVKSEWEEGYLNYLTDFFCACFFQKNQFKKWCSRLKSDKSVLIRTMLLCTQVQRCLISYRIFPKPKVRRSSVLCLILWIGLTSCDLTFFFNVFCYNNNACLSAELRLSRFDFSKEKKRKPIFYLQKIVKSSYATLAFAEVQFKPETEIN